MTPGYSEQVLMSWLSIVLFHRIIQYDSDLFHPAKKGGQFRGYSFLYKYKTINARGIKVYE